MELTVYLPNKEDSAFYDNQGIMQCFKDAFIGAVFMHYKEEHDQRHRDGLISTAEYARFLAAAAEDAHTKANEIFG